MQQAVATAQRERPPAGDALDAMTRILDRPPVLMTESLGGGTRLTRRWSHGGLHESLPALPGHVIVAHHGGDAPITLRSGALRLSAHTRAGTIVIIPEGRMVAGT